jgi:hypothetical protein
VDKPPGEMTRGEMRLTRDHRHSAAPFALVDQVVCCVQGERVNLAAAGSESIEAGITLCRWFTAETVRVNAKLFDSVVERNAAGLVALIRGRGGRRSVRKWMRTSSRRDLNVTTEDAMHARLVELGLGRWIEESQKSLTG